MISTIPIKYDQFIWTVCKWIINIKLNCFSYVAILETIKLCTNKWSLAIYKIFVYRSYISNIYVWSDQDLALNNLQVLICHKTQLTSRMMHAKLYGLIFFVSLLLHGYTTWTLTKRMDKMQDGNDTRMVGWLVGWLVSCVLWYINPCRLFNAKSIFM